VSGLDIVILGLSISSSWGNGHATTYRGLTKGLVSAGNRVRFLEHDMPWYAAHRDLHPDAFGDVHLYADLADLKSRFVSAVACADAVIVGSYVPQGSNVLGWALDSARGVVVFYDIDTPVTVAHLERGEDHYISAALLPSLDLYLSFTGGPLLDYIQRTFDVRRIAPLYCAVDPTVHYAEVCAPSWDLGYLGTFSVDRQPKLEVMLNKPARRLANRRFVIAGPQYPETVAWPANIDRIEHLPPDRHRRFYCRQRFTLNVTRRDMVAAGWSPSVRLFEAAACGVPIISDDWPGLDTLFTPDDEILIARNRDQVISILVDMPDEQRRHIGAAARRRVLGSHTAACRAKELEKHLIDLRQQKTGGWVTTDAFEG
jgi:spore maturation protein CgeB